MLRIALAAGAVALLVGMVAVVDHRHKGRVENAAQEKDWYCRHGRPAACTDFDEVAYEARWERRELGYRISFFGLIASACGLAAVALHRRRE